MIDDSYGDTDLWFETRIRERDRLLHIQASELGVSDPGMRDDLVQEGRIKLWDVLVREPDAKGLLSVATKRRMMRLATGATTWTGQAGRQGLERDPLRRTWDTTDDQDWPLLIEGPGLAEGVELAYHHGELAHALNALPKRHREYVVLRFWGGLSNAEIAALQDVNPSNVARTWTEVIRPALVAHLSHLENA